MNEKPLVSVCIPSYNHARYLPYCLESVLVQTYSNIEIIIVDDGSKDDSLLIARSYANKYPDKIKVYTHPNQENQGISETANLAFSLSKGKYWSGLCSDDAFYREKTEEQVEFLEADKELGFVYSYGDYIDNDGNRIPGKFGEAITKDTDPLKTLLIENVIPAMTVLARRDAIVKVGLQDEKLIYSDWEFWLRFFALYKVGFISKSLVEYRIHDYNTSVGIPASKTYDYIRQVYLKLQNPAGYENSKLMEKEYQDIIAEQLALIPAGKRQLSALDARQYLDEYFTALSLKDYPAARMSLGKAMRASPQTMLHPRRFAAILKHAIINLPSLLKSLER